MYYCVELAINEYEVITSSGHWLVSLVTVDECLVINLYDIESIIIEQYLYCYPKPVESQ